MSLPQNMQPPPGAVNQGALGPNQAFTTIPDTRVLQRYDQLEAAKGNEAFALGATQGPTVATIYKAGMPIRMVSALDPTALREGEFSLLQNVRPDSGAIVARYPTTLFGGVSTTFSPSLPGGSIARGCWSGNLNGTQYVFTAWYDGSAVRIYSSTDGHAFTEQTGSSSPYGYGGAATSTRMADSGSNCAFQSFTHSDGKDYLVVQNGTASPLVYSTTAVNGVNIFPHATVTAPSGLIGTAPRLETGAGRWNFRSDTFTETNSSGHLAFAPVPAGGPATLSITTSVVAGDNAILADVSGNTIGDSGQFCIVADYPSGSSNLLATLKLEVWDSSGSAWHTIYDPGGSIGSAPSTALLGTPIGSNPTSAYCWNLQGIISNFTITKLRFTWPSSVAIVPGGTVAINFYAIFGGGYLPYGCGVCVSYGSSASLAESAGVVMPPAFATPTLQDVGAGSTVLGNLPTSPVLYKYVVPAPGSPDYASGVDTMYVYVALPGSTTYGLISKVGVAGYSLGVWSPVNSSAEVPISNGGIGAQPNDALPSPDAYSTCLPKGSCMASGGGRALVGAGSLYWFSEYNLPFRSRLVLDVEGGVARSSSGGYVALPNTEKCSAFAVTATAALGTSSYFLFTDKSTYMVQGPDGETLSSPTLLAAVGCSAPGSVSVYQDAIFFLDDNYQIRKFSYGQSQFYYYQNVNSYQLMVPISKRVVDDQTRGIPSSRISRAVGVAAYDRYYFAYTPPGGTHNTLMLVWDETIGSWVQDTPTVGGSSAEALCSSVVGGAKSVYAQSFDLACYQWENSGSSTVVAVAITSGAMNPGGFDRTFFGRVGVIADSQSGQAFTVTKTLIGGGFPYGAVGSDSSSIDLSTGLTGSQAWRWDCKVLIDGTNGPAGMSGVTAQIGLSASYSPGKRIFGVVQEQMPATPGADSL